MSQRESIVLNGTSVETGAGRARGRVVRAGRAGNYWRVWRATVLTSPRGLLSGSVLALLSATPLPRYCSDALLLFHTARAGLHVQQRARYERGKNEKERDNSGERMREER